MLNDPLIENREKNHSIAVICLFAVVAVAFFGKVIFSEDTLYGSDFVFYFYPTKRFIYEYFCANGSTPFWNPYLFSGTPLIANMQASMFYPLGFLYYLMPADVAYLYSTLLHSTLGAVFMYVFVRSLGTSRPGAFLSGFLFSFNGFFVAHLYAGHLSLVQNYIWIPLIFLFALKFIRTLKLKHAVAGGLFLGFQILGGFPQIAFYTILAVLLFCFYFNCVNVKQHGFPHIFKIFGGAIFLVMLGFLISAIQLLPTYEFTGLSTRSGGVGYEFATLDSLPPVNLLTFLFPLLFGSPADGTYWINDRTWEFWEYCAYVGIVPLATIFLSLRNLLRDRTCLFFVLLALTALSLAFGKHNPLYPLIYRLPGFHSFRIPAQILFLFVFSVCILTGKAVDFLKDSPIPGKGAKRVIVAILFFSFPLVAGAYAFPKGLCGFISRIIGASTIDAERLLMVVSIMSRSIFLAYCILFTFSVVCYLRQRKNISCGVFTGILIGLCIIDLWLFVFPFIRPFDMRGLLQKGQALSHIAGDSQVSRSVVKGNCFIENAGLWYGFQDIQGYDPLILRRYVEYINKSQGLAPDDKVVNLHYIQAVNNPLIRMLNLKYMVDCQSRQIQAYDNFIPRCWIVHQSVVKEKDQVLNFMMGRDFHPSAMVVFEREESPETVAPVVSGNGELAGESCRIVSCQNGDLHVRANMGTSGFLILSEIYYPGWQAFVNGKEVPILRGNYLFRVIDLEPGQHDVQLTFKPFSFRAGALISLVVLGAIIIYLISALRASPPGKGKPFNGYDANEAG